MRLSYLPILLILLLPLCNVMAQPDISDALAQPVSLKFDNLEMSVEEYFQAVVDADSTCCDSADFFLIIKYDATGTVTMAKPATDAPNCTMKLITEAAYDIRWEARRGIDTKTLYLDLNVKSSCNN